MVCPDCGNETVAFPVPDALREYAPDGASRAAICTVCLRTVAAEDGRGDGGGAPAEADFSSVAPFFPRGEGGVAVALLLGKLDSLALNRAAVEALLARAERGGADALLTLDRLAAAESVRPHFDADRRRRQVEQLAG